MKLITLCFGIALSALPMVATAAASGAEDCYYYHGYHYPYRWHGHYWRYRWHGGYYNYHYGHRYYRHRYRCNVQGWCYR